ncbi:MAG: hypothetical protein CMP23_14095 [Rickettsiales bacterium]|nr:hypothetical protein [Rickettsiales bacterium]|tara:strand:- start:3574 stop:4305 length:732 start_codon:yes stop_codon:yes gene_type:complete
MSTRFGNSQHVQLVAMDHGSLFSVVVYAYERVRAGRSERAILHRAVLSLDYRADPDEINRLRAIQRGLRELDSEEAQSQAEQLEGQIQREHGADRNASALSSLTLEEVLELGARWSVVGKRGAPIPITAQLIGLLEQLYAEPQGLKGALALDGLEEPRTTDGRLLFSSPGSLPSYRSPDSVAEIYRSLSFIDRNSLDAAIDSVVGDRPDSEEIATWLERDFEALTERYEVAASGGLGLQFRYS